SCRRYNTRKAPLLMSLREMVWRSRGITRGSGEVSTVPGLRFKRVASFGLIVAPMGIAERANSVILPRLTGIRSLRLAVRTSPSQGGNTSSSLVGSAIIFAIVHDRLGLTIR